MNFPVTFADRPQIVIHLESRPDLAGAIQFSAYISNTETPDFKAQVKRDDWDTNRRHDILIMALAHFETTLSVPEQWEPLRQKLKTEIADKITSSLQVPFR